MSKIEKRLEEATRARQAILDKAKNLGDPGKTGPYDDAIDFILAAGTVPDEELSSLAVRHGSVLLEMLAGSPEVMQYFSEKQIDYGAIAADIRNILHGLLFNKKDDYYISLLLPSNADESLINRRWKELMRLYHPDRNLGGTMPADYAAEGAKRLNEVYNVLKDQSRKFKYDQQSGRYGEQILERPSFFTDPHRKDAKFGGHRNKYLAFAGIFAVLAVAAAAGTLYLRIPARHPVVSSGTPRVENKAADVILPLKDNAEDRVGVSVMSPDRKTFVARKTDGPSGPRQDVSLAEDVYGFVSRLEAAFKHGDLKAYLSCYSASAIENGMNYGRIREYYKNLFTRGGTILSMRNMIISEERNSIRARGLYAIEMPPEGKAGNSSRGSFAMRLARENGRLKIMDFQRVINNPAAD